MNSSQCALGLCFLIVFSLLNESSSSGLKTYSLMVKRLLMLSGPAWLGSFLPWKDSGNNCLWIFTSRRIFLCWVGRLSLWDMDADPMTTSPVICSLEGGLWQRWTPGYREKILFQILTNPALMCFWIVILLMCSFLMFCFSNFVSALFKQNLCFFLPLEEIL